MERSNNKDEKKERGKLLPSNIEAERSLLGCILISDKVYDKISTIVDAEDFYDPTHKKIFEVIKEMSLRGEAIDYLTLTNVLRSRGILESVGGASYISSLSDAVPTYAHAEEYAKIVREKSILRHLIDISTKVIEDSYKESKSPEEILENAERAIFRVREKEQTSSIKKVRDLVSDVYEEIKKSGLREDALQGLPTGFSKIDNFILGLQPENLIIIAARPSVGKTSLAMTIAYHLGVEKKHNILIFSFEMSQNDLIMKFIAACSKVNLHKIRTGRFLTKSQEQHIIHALSVLAESSIYIDTDDNDVFDIRSKARDLMAELKRQNKTLDLIIIDYLQLIRPNEKLPREQQISQISRSLKALARELKVPVIALSQLNREAEKRETPLKKKSTDGPVISYPKLSDLRESGAIEQDADVVIFIARDAKGEYDATGEYMSGEKFSHKAIKCKLIIAKNRNGPLGEQSVAFIKDLTLFQQESQQDTDEMIKEGVDEPI
ncbi:MAG: replicative DNA helicase [Candidatus Goldbacteria bacterium]|nr:replicative DNA helicase [Candidatus Goldiibacteriota bacterium]